MALRSAWVLVFGLACGCGDDAGSSASGGATSGGTNAGAGTSSSGGTSSSAGTAGTSAGGAAGATGGSSAAQADPPPALGSGDSYYVSPSGSDDNSGLSPDQAWRTLDKVNQTSFAGGDNILLEGGQSFAGTLRLGDDDLGSEQAPIGISSYGSGRATIEAGIGAGVDLYNTAGIQLWELALHGDWNDATQSGSDQSGVNAYVDLGDAQKLSYLVVDRVEISGFGQSGVSIGAWPEDGSKSGYETVRITSSSIHHNGSSGITSWGYTDVGSTAYAHAGIVVRHCQVFENRGLLGQTHHSGSGIMLGDVDGALIEHSVAHDNGANNQFAGGGPVGIWAWDSNDVVIQFNESYSNDSQTIDGGGFDIDGGVTNSVVQYNFSHDNHGPGILIAEYTGARRLMNNVVRYNVSQNDARGVPHGAIHFWNGNAAADLASVHVYNNTVFFTPNGMGGSALALATATTDVVIANNAFVTTGGAPLLQVDSAQAGLVVRGNAYWATGGAFLADWTGTTYSDLAGMRGGTGQERDGATDYGLFADPLLSSPGEATTLGDATLLDGLSSYRLSAGSPLVDQGLDLAQIWGFEVGARDFWGNPLPAAALDIGAHELPLP